MRALITGASSGIGKEMAIYLAKKGIDLVLVARDKDRLEEFAKTLENVKVEAVSLDLSDEKNCLELYENVKDIDILINNAGFGTFGNFTETDLQTELNMIKTNISAVHILTKLYLKEMVKKDIGYILNVASIAAFMPGPLMTTYYSTKSYVFRLSESIYQELKRLNSKVSISCLCPGPTKTDFLKKANVKFSVSNMEAKYVARYAIDGMLNKKRMIIPGFSNKGVRFLSKIVPDRIIAKVTYKLQKKRQ